MFSLHHASNAHAYTRPGLNCKKHGDTCDYTVDLKWNGRQKREPDRVSKTTTPTKQASYSVGVFNTRPEGTNTAGDSIISSIPQTQYGIADFGQSQRGKDETQIQLHQPSSISPNAFFGHPAPISHQPQSESSLIDPALMSSMLPPTGNSTNYESRYTGQRTFDEEKSSPSEGHTGHSTNHEARYDGRRTLEQKSDVSEGHSAQDPRDLHRLSVSSLLSGPPGIPHLDEQVYRPSTDLHAWPLQYTDPHQDFRTWGTDRGFKDLDIPQNDDANAISGSSPVAMREHLEMVYDHPTPPEFGFGMETNSTAFDSGNYYDKPVSINIPRALEPLPNKLLENPMNLLVGFLGTF